MSKANITFQSSIKDAEVLLAHFDAVNQFPPPENAEVLKRAGLVMALTAWETYVEDLTNEVLQFRLQSINGSHFGGFIQNRLNKDLKYFHNPNSDKTKSLFLDYLGIDVTEFWKWNNYDQKRVKKTLDDLISRRGEAVHRSRPLQQGIPAPHLVKREDLEKAIRFLKCLVEATENAIAEK
jgi:hypothetical protein